MPPTTSKTPTGANGLTKAPALPWLSVWLPALIVFVLSLVGLEAFWRAHGLVPAVTDTPELWAHYRNCVYRADGKVVVLIGSSRMQAAIDMEAFRRECPGCRVIQLAKSNAGSPMSTLFDLARDERFLGTVICEISYRFVLSRHDGDQAFLCRMPRGLLESVDALAIAGLQSILSCGNRRASCYESLRAIVRGWDSGPNDTHQSPIFAMRLGRDLTVDFAKVRDLEQYRRTVCWRLRSEYATNGTCSPDSFTKELLRIEEGIRPLRNRGGNVVFIRLPSSGELRRAERLAYPKALYWDKWTSVTSATLMDFEDVPTLAAICCPDGSHVDFRDAPRFTAAMIKELRRRPELLQLR